MSVFAMNETTEGLIIAVESFVLDRGEWLSDLEFFHRTLL
jgi:hypothetical protein